MTKVAGSWFVHLGLHKTVTSFLQRSIYPSFSRVRYLHKPLLQYMVTARPEETLVICEEALLRDWSRQQHARACAQPRCDAA